MSTTLPKTIYRESPPFHRCSSKWCKGIVSKASKDRRATTAEIPSARKKERCSSDAARGPRSSGRDAWSWALLLGGAGLEETAFNETGGLRYDGGEYRACRRATGDVIEVLTLLISGFGQESWACAVP